MCIRDSIIPDGQMQLDVVETIGVDEDGKEAVTDVKYTLTTGDETVSYTHLDVYKRQDIHGYLKLVMVMKFLKLMLVIMEQQLSYI